MKILKVKICQQQRSFTKKKIVKLFSNNQSLFFSCSFIVDPVLMGEATLKFLTLLTISFSSMNALQLYNNHVLIKSYVMLLYNKITLPEL